MSELQVIDPLTFTMRQGGGGGGKPAFDSLAVARLATRRGRSRGQREFLRTSLSVSARITTDLSCASEVAVEELSESTTNLCARKHDVRRRSTAPRCIRSYPASTPT